eukprot:gene3284-13311_t
MIPHTFYSRADAGIGSVRLPPIAENSSLLPPVGVWAVSQSHAHIFWRAQSLTFKLALHIYNPRYKQLENVQEQYKVGDLVDVRGHGRATIIEPLQLDPEAPPHTRGRYRVQYHEDDTTFYLSAARLRRMKPALDGFDLQAALALSPTGSYEKVMIDISGQAELSLAASMVRLYADALPAATIILKNRAVHAYLTSQTCSDRLSVKAEPEEHDQAVSDRLSVKAEPEEHDQADTQGVALPTTATTVCPNSGPGATVSDRNAGEAECMSGLEEMCEVFVHRAPEYTKSSDASITKAAERKRLQKERRAERRKLQEEADAVTKKEVV